MTKKIQVSFSDTQLSLLGHLKGELGKTNADVVRNIVISWLAEKSFLTSFAKRRLKLENKKDLSLVHNDE